MRPVDGSGLRQLKHVAHLAQHVLCGVREGETEGGREGVREGVSE